MLQSPIDPLVARSLALYHSYQAGSASQGAAAAAVAAASGGAGAVRAAGGPPHGLSPAHGGPPPGHPAGHPPGHPAGHPSGHPGAGHPSGHPSAGLGMAQPPHPSAAKPPSDKIASDHQHFLHLSRKFFSMLKRHSIVTVCSFATYVLHQSFLI